MRYKPTFDEKRIQSDIIKDLYEKCTTGVSKRTWLLIGKDELSYYICYNDIAVYAIDKELFFIDVNQIDCMTININDAIKPKKERTCIYERDEVFKVGGKKTKVVIYKCDDEFIYINAALLKYHNVSEYDVIYDGNLVYLMRYGAVSLSICPIKYQNVINVFDIP